MKKQLSLRVVIAVGLLVVIATAVPVTRAQRSSTDSASKFGRISGRVWNTDGAPISFVFVHASIVTVEDGRRKLRPVSSVRTDSTGRYVLERLTPGEYYIHVDTRPGYFGVYHPGGLG